MTIENARYTNPEHTQVSADFDGVTLNVPAVEGNRHYRQLLDAGVAITSYADAKTIDQVKAERVAELEQMAAGYYDAGLVDYDLAGDGSDLVTVPIKDSFDREALNAIATNGVILDGQGVTSAVIFFGFANDEDRNLTSTQAINLGQTALSYISDIQSNVRSHRRAINNDYSTKSGVQGHDLTTGWPSS